VALEIDRLEHEPPVGRHLTHRARSAMAHGSA